MGFPAIESFEVSVLSFVNNCDEYNNDKIITTFYYVSGIMLRPWHVFPHKSSQRDPILILEKVKAIISVPLSEKSIKCKMEIGLTLRQLLHPYYCGRLSFSFFSLWKVNISDKHKSWTLNTNALECSVSSVYLEQSCQNMDKIKELGCTLFSQLS